MAAQALVGTPYRVNGRSVDTGVDCIGLVSLALAAIGRMHSPLPTYGLRNLNRARFAHLLVELGLVEARGDSGPGDIVLLRPSAAQYHLAIIGPDDMPIHAHAGLRRVVTSPAPLPWPTEEQWQIAGE